MGAVANLRPDLFAAIVAEVPFVDVVTTMLDPTLPLTITEWEEWGDPREPDAYAWMKAYSPYDNVRDAAVPGDARDDRAQRSTRAVLGTGEVGREAADAHDTSDRPIMLRTELGAGHGGPSGRYDAWRDEAMILAFVCDAVGRRRHDRAAAASSLHTRRRRRRSRREWTRRRRAAARGTVVLCHPHPQYGGTMRSIVISALFEALPAAGYAACASTSAASRAAAASTAAACDEPHDVAAALDDARSHGRRRRAARARRLVVRRRHGAVGRRPARSRAGSAIAPPLRFRVGVRGRSRTTRGRSIWCSRSTTSSARPTRSQPRSRRGSNTTTEVVSGRESLLRRPHRPGDRGDRRRSSPTSLSAERLHG